MASVDVAKLQPQQLAELACTYASLILHDDGQDITGDKLSKLIQSAGVKIQAYWPSLFAKALEGQNISSLFHFGGSATEAEVVQPAAKSAPVAEKKEEKKAGKKEQPKKEAPKAQQEEDGGMGGLFD